jgi:branched-chain amino acid transport system substrate-binding protein
MWLALAAAVIFSGCQKEETGQPTTQPGAYRVGAVVPLSGSGAALGTLIRRGLEMGMEDVNARPDGKRIEMVFEDSETKPAKGLTAFRKVVDVDKTKVVLVGFSAVCNITAPAAEDSDVLMVGMTTSMPGLVENRKHVIRLFMTADVAAGTIAQYCAPRFSRLAVLYADDEYGKSTFAAFQKKFVRDGKEIVFSEAFKPEEKEFRTTVAKMLDTKPDAVFLPGYGPGYITLMNKIRERDKQIAILGDSPLTNPAVYRAAGEAADGAVVPATPLDAGLADTPAQKAFLEKYRQRFNENPSINVTINYDFVQILADALAKTDGSPQAIRDYFTSLKGYQGITGPITYQPNGESDVTVRPMQIKGGTIVPLKD